MEVVNHKEQVPFEHYCRMWRKLDPHAAAARSGVPFDEAAGTFRVTLRGVAYRLSWTGARALRSKAFRRRFC